MGKGGRQTARGRFFGHPEGSRGICERKPEGAEGAPQGAREWPQRVSKRGSSTEKTCETGKKHREKMVYY